MFYVYIYRDDRGRIRYVGRGTEFERSQRHETASHNPDLATFIASEKYSVHISGPYRDDVEMAAVESALISALQVPPYQELLFNRVPGDGHRFVPVGVPFEFAHRLDAAPLLATDLPAITGSTTIFVNISRKKLHDGREGYNPVLVPDDPQIVDRIIQSWWFSEHEAGHWAHDPAIAPAALVAGFGSGARKTIIGSVMLDRWAWATMKPDHAGYFKLPVLDTAGLDAHGLRGRRVDLPDGMRFNLMPEKKRFVLLLRPQQKIRP